MLHRRADTSAPDRQGYYFSRPLPAAELAPLIEADPPAWCAGGP